MGLNFFTRILHYREIDHFHIVLLFIQILCNYQHNLLIYSTIIHYIFQIN